MVKEGKGVDMVIDLGFGDCCWIGLYKVGIIEWQIQCKEMCFLFYFVDYNYSFVEICLGVVRGVC